MKISLEQILNWTHTEEQEANVRGHQVRLVQTLEVVPEGAEDKSLLDMGSFMQMAPVCRFVLNYGRVQACYLGTKARRGVVVMSREGQKFDCLMDCFNAEKDTFPYSSAAFDTVLCCEVLSHLQNDPMWTLFEINRILKPGGMLVLSAPNAACVRSVWKVLHGYNPAYFAKYIVSGDPRLTRDYSEHELNSLARDAGFQSVLVKGCNYMDEFSATDQELLKFLKASGFPDQPREECLVMLAQKISDPVMRYPKWLYF